MTTVCSEKSCYGQHKVDKDCLEVKGQKLQWGSNVYFGQYSNLRARIWSNNIRNYNDWMNPYISRFSILLLLLWGIFNTMPPLRHRQSENMARLPGPKLPAPANFSPEFSNMTSRPSCDSLNWIEDCLEAISIDRNHTFELQFDTNRQDVQVWYKGITELDEDIRILHRRIARFADLPAERL